MFYQLFTNILLIVLSTESKLRPKRSSISKSRKMVSILTKHIKDNHEMWTKVLKEEEEEAKQKEEKEKVESPEKMSMPLIREDSEERNSDDRAAIEEAQLKVIEEKNSALKASPSSAFSPPVASSLSKSSPNPSSSLSEGHKPVALTTNDEHLEAAPHEPLQDLSETSDGAASAEEVPIEQKQQLESDSMEARKDT